MAWDRAHKITHTKPLMRSLQLLNVFQINIQNILVFMYRVKTCSDVPSTLQINLPVLPIDIQQISRKGT